MTRTPLGWVCWAGGRAALSSGCPSVRLQPRGARREHASAESLMEYILESFSFLSAHIAPHELALFGGSQGPR